MAEDGSWDSIKQHGLLSTTALLDKWEISGTLRQMIESNYRPQSITIENINYGKAVIRDQKPISPDQLGKCLPPNITVNDWYRFINKKVFFWPNWTSLKWFLSAREYINKIHTVLCIDTETLLSDHKNELKLSPINSGSAYPQRNKTVPEPRDYDVFKNIKDYANNWVREIAIDHSLPDFRRFLIWSRRYVAEEKLGYNNEPTFKEELV